MPKFLPSTSLSYKDVNLIAQPAVIESRKEIPVEMHRIVVSAMTAIIGPTFIKAVAELPNNYQPTLHIPRDIFKLDNLNLCGTLGLKRIFVGVGLNEDKDYEAAALEWKYETAFIDIANGYLPQIKDRVKQLKDKGFKTVICGSVHTEEGAHNLMKAGCTVIRLGIAPGSVCITKDSTGYTRGTISEIAEINSYKMGMREALEKEPFLIMSDGGLKSPSDYVKAFMAGADYTMGGRIFTEALECRMHSEDYMERYYSKESVYSVGFDNASFPKGLYFGMASNWGKIAMGNPSDNIEGTSTIIQPQFSLKDIIDTLWAGIASGVSYSGHATLSESIGNGVFEVIK